MWQLTRKEKEEEEEDNYSIVQFNQDSDVV
jgi:hypothetical protein